MTLLLSSVLEPADVVFDIRAASKSALFEALTRHMELLHGLPRVSVTAALMRREMGGTTALGHGIAIPHARVQGIDRIRMLYFRLAQPLAFGAFDGEDVRDVICLVVPGPACQAHLDLLAELAMRISEPHFRSTLRACGSAYEVVRLFDAGVR